MNAQDIISRNKQLNELLKELSKISFSDLKSNEKSVYYQRLESIYCNGTEKLRHHYSEIYSTLSLIGKEGDEPLECLISNLKDIQKGYNPKNKSANISLELNKLFDHINLDTARLIEANRNNKLVQKRLKELEYQNAVLNAKNSVLNEKNAVLNENQKKIEKSIKKAKDMEKNYITILGIFASIVIAMVGSLTMTSSVFNNIASVSVYRLIFVAGSVAFFFVNLIYLMVWFILKIHRDDDVKYPVFMWVINIFVVLVVGADVIIWYCFKV